MVSAFASGINDVLKVLFLYASRLKAFLKVPYMAQLGFFECFPHDVNGLSLFRCAIASLYEVVSVHPSVRPSVRPSVGPYVPCYFRR